MVVEFRKCLHRSSSGERFKAKLGTKAEIEFFVICERLHTMPYIPVMYIPPILCIRFVERTTRRRRRWPVKHPRCILFHLLRNHILKLLDIICFQRGVMCHHIRPLHPAELHLIIAADKAQTSVMPDTHQIVPQFRADIFFKCCIHSVYIAGKHGILPYNQT